MNPLSVILEEFNDLWGTEFTDADQVKDLIAGSRADRGRWRLPERATASRRGERPHRA